METVKIIFIVVLTIVVVVAVVGRLVRSIKRKIRRVTRQFTSTANLLSNLARYEEQAVQVKSVGGATSMFLQQIEKDFSSYHNPDAESAIQSFLLEYLDVRYKGKKSFSSNLVKGNILLNVPKEANKSISDVIFNGISIYDYKKTKDYATVVYRCSMGYNVNGKRVETRFEVDYTYQIQESGIATVSMKCNNCGATYDSTSQGVCPYCGAEVIKDTVMTWFITEIKER